VNFLSKLSVKTADKLQEIENKLAVFEG